MNKSQVLWIVFGFVLIFQDLIRVIIPYERLIFLDEVFFFLLITSIFLEGKFQLVNKYKFLYLIIIFIFYEILVEIYSNNISFRSLLYIIYSIKFYLIFIAGYCVSEKKFIDEYFKYIKVLFYIILIGGIIDFITGGLIINLLGLGALTYRNNIYRVHSIFRHPVYFGWFMALSSGWFLINIIINKHKNVLLYYLGLSLSTILLVLSGNRKSLVAFMIAFCLTYLYVLSGKISIKNKIKIGIIGFIVLSFIMAFSINYFAGILYETQSEYLQTDYSPRFILYSVAYEIFTDNFPFGSGVGTYGSIGSLRPYSDIYYEYGLYNVPGFSESDPSFIMDALWPSIIAELGFIGIIIYCLLLIISIKILLHCKKMGLIDIRYIAIVFFILFESIIESIVSPTFSEFVYLYFIFGSIGILLGAIKNESTHVRDEV